MCATFSIFQFRIISILIQSGTNVFSKQISSVPTIIVHCPLSIVNCPLKIPSAQENKRVSLSGGVQARICARFNQQPQPQPLLSLPPQPPQQLSTRIRMMIQQQFPLPKKLPMIFPPFVYITYYCKTPKTLQGFMVSAHYFYFSVL